MQTPVWVLCLWVVVTWSGVECRQVRVRPVATLPDQDSRQAEYYAEQSEDEGGPVLVSRQDTYGRATGQARVNPRFKTEQAREPPVQTIRNYNKLNDDGSFTFGYEADDGSFKEETRGTDCVVRGKYGYVDPDGNKREFSYVSGNPCDPNAPQEEEEPQQLPDSGEENIPANANIPLRRPNRPRPQSPPTTLYQQNYNYVSSQEDEAEENIPAHAPARTSTARSRPVTSTYRPTSAVAVQAPVFRGSPTPKAAFVSPTPKTPAQAVRITPRPATVEPATTYRPQLLEATASPTPPSFTKHYRPPSGELNFDEEFKKFQLENNVVSTTSRPSKGGASDPIYSTELVFDPSSGQYNTVLYQALPQSSGGDFSLRGRLPQFVADPFRPSPFMAYQPPQYQQQLFQQGQVQQLQQSQQLFAQQQQKQRPAASTSRLENSRNLQSQGFPSSLLQQEPQTFQSQPTRNPEPARAAPPPRFAPSPYQHQQQHQPQGVQSFYYVNPQASNQNNLAAGQIDAFLRGHSLSI